MMHNRSISGHASTVLLLLFGVVCPIIARSADEARDRVRSYQCQVEPDTDENFSLADVQCWLPPANQKVFGMLCIVLHPHGNGGVRFDNPQPWITLAKKYHCGLLSISFIPRDFDSSPWCHASKGSGRALLASIDQIAEKSSLSALRKCPLIVAGICEAGQFSYEFAAFQPARTRAFFTMGGGKHVISLAGEAASVPGLLVAATDRGEQPLRNMLDLFAAGRKHSAPWSFSAEPIGDYDKGLCSTLTAAFIENALRRLGDESPEMDHYKTVADLMVPIRKAPFLGKECPNDISGVILALRKSTLDCQFLDKPTLDEWLVNPGYDKRLNLSFVSVPLPEVAVVSPPTIDFGTMDLNSGGGTGLLNVHCKPEAQVDKVDVESSQKGLYWKVQQTATDDWRIECGLNPKYFPCGAFHVEIPVRFLHSGQTIPGGVSAFGVGKIVGDIRPTPVAIAFDNTASRGERHLRLTSASGSTIEVLNIQSTSPQLAKAEVDAKGHSFVDIQCSFASPAGPEESGVTGYYLIRAKSLDIETIKVLFY